jgi:hypothetical protein
MIFSPCLPNRNELHSHEEQIITENKTKTYATQIQTKTTKSNIDSSYIPLRRRNQTQETKLRLLGTESRGLFELYREFPTRKISSFECKESWLH